MIRYEFRQRRDIRKKLRASKQQKLIAMLIIYEKRKPGCVIDAIETLEKETDHG